jgi:hypothetical protein
MASARGKKKSASKESAPQPAKDEAPQLRTFALEMLYPVDPLPIAHVNFLKFSHFGGEILMDIGTIDDQAAIARISGTAAEGNEDKAIKAYVTSRFGMSPQTFGMLRRNIEDLWEKMRASGAAKKVGLEDA